MTLTMTDGIGQIGQRGCRTKRRHNTRGYAEAQMQNLITGGANPELLNVYQCKRCSGWHVGHRPSNQRKL